MNLYSDDFLKDLFTDILDTPATEKIMVVCSFVDKDSKRHFNTYLLPTFRANIGTFMENGRLSLNDPNFIDQSNVLNHVSDPAESYFPPLHLIDTIEFKRSIEYMKDVEKCRKKEEETEAKKKEPKEKKPRSTNEGGLFPYFIANPSKLSQDLLARLERYQILTDLNSEAYHSNCFLYAPRQSGVVPEDVINMLNTHISHTHIKSRDIRFLGKKVSLNFLRREPTYRPSKDKFELEFPGGRKNNHIFGVKENKYTSKPNELFFYENHWMHCDADIEYNGETYNIYRFLEALIKEGILKPMTVNDTGLINSQREVYLNTPSEIKLSEFNPKLFEFQQYIPQESPKNTIEANIFYADFESTTDGECHQPYLCFSRKEEQTS